MKRSIPLHKIRDIEARDFASVVPMLGALLCVPFVRRKYANSWLVCDRESGEHDNGYHFFKYLREHHPEQPCTFYVSKASAFYDDVKCLGNTAKYGGLSHWLAYFCSEYVITSQSGRPNEHLCTLFERLGLFAPPRVFLQHGVTINRPPYLMSDKLTVEYFVTTTPQEYKDIRAIFGHPKESVILTGFPRFDALHDLPDEPSLLLIMPTWRKWLSEKSERMAGSQGESLLKQYSDSWSRLINDERLHDMAKECGLEIVLFVHSNMRSVLNLGSLDSGSVRFAHAGEDLQDCMKRSAALITDYSSVFFDFAYMKKPSIFYQFDEEMYRERHYPQGWFNYHDTSFGTVCKSADEAMDALARLKAAGFEPDGGFLEEHSRTFPLYDCLNSERLYQVLHRE